MKSLAKLFLSRFSCYLGKSRWGNSHLDKLAGQVIELNIPNARLIYRIGIEKSGLSFSQAVPTLIIKGDIKDLLSLVYYAKRGQSLPAGCVEITGDLSVMQDLQNLILTIGSGFEEFLIESIGHVGAHRLIRAYEKLNDLGADKAKSFSDQVKEYLIFEINLLPAPSDIALMEQELYGITENVDKIEIRLNQVMKKSQL